MKYKIIADNIPESCKKCRMSTVLFEGVPKRPVKTVEMVEACILIGDKIPENGRCKRCPINLGNISEDDKDIVVDCG